MNLTKSIYDAFKAVMTIEARIDQLRESVAVVSHKLEDYTERMTAKLESHSERLARLEGKFDLLENSLAARRRRLPE
jgi:peptidoglycan hydrolase CwlO-like protein